MGQELRGKKIRAERKRSIPKKISVSCFAVNIDFNTAEIERFKMYFLRKRWPNNSSRADGEGVLHDAEAGGGVHRLDIGEPLRRRGRKTRAPERVEFEDRVQFSD